MTRMSSITGRPGVLSPRRSSWTARTAARSSMQTARSENAVTSTGTTERPSGQNVQTAESLDNGNPAHHLDRPLAPGLGPDHHSLGLAWHEPDQALHRESGGDHDERARPAPVGHDLLQRNEPVRTPVGSRHDHCGLDRSERHEPRGLEAAAPGRREDLVHAHAVLAERLADGPGLLPPSLVHVALGRAVVEL